MPFDRRAYNRDYMRRWRAKRKEPKADPHAACDAEIERLKRRLAELIKENERLRQGLAF